MLAYAKEQLDAHSQLRAKYNKPIDPSKRYTDQELSQKMIDQNVVNETGNYELPHFYTSTTRTLLSTDVDANVVGTKQTDKITFNINTAMDKLKRVLIVQTWPAIKFNKEGLDSIINKAEYECEMRLCEYAGFMRYDTTELTFFDKTFSYDSYDAMFRSIAEESDPDYLNRSIGNDDMFTSWHDYIPTHTTRTPTKFGFENNDAVSLPLLYITSDVTISLKTRDFWNLVQVRYRYRTGDGWSEWKMMPRSNIKPKLFKDVTMPDPKLYVTYSKLSTEQREKVFGLKKEFRLPFMLYKKNDVEVPSYAEHATVSPVNCNTIKHYIAVQNMGAEKLNNYSNFTDTVDGDEAWSPYTNIIVKHGSSVICEIPYEIVTTENVRHYCSGRPKVKGFGVIGFQEERQDKPFDPTHIPIESYQFLFDTTDIYELSKDDTIDEEEDEQKKKKNTNYKILFRTVSRAELIFVPTDKLTHDGRKIYTLTVIDS